MKSSDAIVVSTPALQQLAAERTGKPCHLWRNGVDAETRLAASLASRRQEQDVVTIGYASGSRAHEADFSEAEDAVVALLAASPNARLAVIGHHRPSPQLAALGNRVVIEPFSDYPAYLKAVAGFDINIVPLLHDPFNACKSAIRYLDAAVVGTPTIASRTGDFENLIDHGRTGLLANSKAAWLPLLERLVANASGRRAMGEAAKRHAAEAMDAGSLAASVDRAYVAGLWR